VRPPSLLVDGLATFRLARLATQDRLLDRPRDALVRSRYRHAGREAIERPIPEVPGAWAEHAREDDDPPMLATLATCPVCASVWLAAGVVAARRLAPRHWGPLADTLALAAIAGLLNNAERG